jgi:hypothetical protein
LRDVGYSGVWGVFWHFFTEDLMTTVNNMTAENRISRQFTGREYINDVDGENKFKDKVTRKIKDRQAAGELVDVLIKSSPSFYVYFTYNG